MLLRGISGGLLPQGRAGACGAGLAALGRRSLPRSGAPMLLTRRALGALALPAILAACGRTSRSDARAPVPADLHPGETPEMRALIVKYAAFHGIPESLLHRVIQRESDYNPRRATGLLGADADPAADGADHGLRGPARGAAGCRDQPDLRRALPARGLAGLGGNEEEAVGWYARGYYYEAKRLGL